MPPRVHLQCKCTFHWSKITWIHLSFYANTVVEKCNVIIWVLRNGSMTGSSNWQLRNTDRPIGYATHVILFIIPLTSVVLITNWHLRSLYTADTRSYQYIFNYKLSQCDLLGLIIYIYIILIYSYFLWLIFYVITISSFFRFN